MDETDIFEDVERRVPRQVAARADVATFMTMFEHKLRHQHALSSSEVQVCIVLKLLSGSGSGVLVLCCCKQGHGSSICGHKPCLHDHVRAQAAPPARPQLQRSPGLLLDALLVACQGGLGQVFWSCIAASEAMAVQDWHPVDGLQVDGPVEHKLHHQPALGSSQV